jgi:hypothetical protein
MDIRLPGVSESSTRVPADPSTATRSPLAQGRAAAASLFSPRPFPSHQDAVQTVPRVRRLRRPPRSHRRATHYSSSRLVACAPSSQGRPIVGPVRRDGWRSASARADSQCSICGIRRRDYSCRSRPTCRAPVGESGMDSARAHRCGQRGDLVALPRSLNSCRRPGRRCELQRYPNQHAHCPAERRHDQVGPAPSQTPDLSMTATDLGRRSVAGTVAVGATRRPHAMGDRPSGCPAAPRGTRHCGGFTCMVVSRHQTRGASSAGRIILCRGGPGGSAGLDADRCHRLQSEPRDVTPGCVKTLVDAGTIYRPTMRPLVARPSDPRKRRGAGPGSPCHPFWQSTGRVSPHVVHGAAQLRATKPGTGTEGDVP